MSKEKIQALVAQVAANDIFGQFRFFKNDEEEIWWVAKDVCKFLGIRNHRDAVGRLDEDEKDDVGITDAIGRVQDTLVVNESGLYSLVFMSRKPAAKKFRKWVTSEVLPSIRKYGYYKIDREIEIELQEGETELDAVLRTFPKAEWKFAGVTEEVGEDGKTYTNFNIIMNIEDYDKIFLK